MRSLVSAIALATALTATAARAQEQELNFERLMLDPSGQGSLVVGTGEIGPRNYFRLSAAGHWEHLPLSLVGSDVLGRVDRGTPIVKDRTTIETTIDFVPLNNIEIYGRVPYVVDQKSDVAGIEKSGIGTPSIGVRFGLLQERAGAPVNVAFGVEVLPPWGKKEILSKEGKIAGQIMGEVGKTFGNILVGGQVGLIDREDVQLGATSMGSDVMAGAVVALAKGAFRPELSYRFAQNLSGGPGSSELLAGLRAILGPVEGFVLGGPGFGSAPGTPQWRGLAGLAIRFEPSEHHAAPAAAAPAPAPVAAPPPPPPPPDPCAPGQTHTPQQCPNLDDDNDGVLNRDDACPTEKGPAENRGCPVKDRDNDGVPDDQDKCPDQAGPKENQGCPLAQISKEAQKIDISQKVQFDTGKATIKPESDQLLTAVADLLKAHPEVKKVSIQGYTDSVGGAAMNKKLSQRRADSVLAALVKLGVEKARLEAKGFGPANPVAPNDTVEGRDANRRVEFVIRGIDQPAK